MKKAVLHFFSTMRAVCLRGGAAQIIRCLSPLLAFYLCLSALICGCFSSVSYASSPYEDIGARDSLYAATKQALNLDVGEPRTVRMIYFLPNDRPFKQGVVDRMKVTIRQIQTFYADQMEAHGYGRKTFRFETDAQGDPVVHRVDGQHPDNHYHDNTISTAGNEIRQAFDVRQNIYFIVVDKSIDGIGLGSGRPRPPGVGGRFKKNSGDAWVTGEFFFSLTAHELGHAFGLSHDFRDGAYIMSYGSFSSRERKRLSACAAKFLSVHPHFDSHIPIEETSPPTIELISLRTYPAGSKNVPVRLKVRDSDGVHQVLLSIQHGDRGTLKACRGVNGEKDTVVQFDYDGVLPSAQDPSYSKDISLLDPLVHELLVEVVDIKGNTFWKPLWLFSETLQPLTKISGDNQHGLPNTPLPVPFVVEMRDLNDGSVLQGVWITFAITTGGGTLSVERVETDHNGRAESTLTLGPDLGPTTVAVSAAGGQETVVFNAMAGGVVSIPDPNLRAAIGDILNKAPGDPIAPAEMATLTWLKKPNSDIRDLTGLEFATHLKILEIKENPISDLSILAGLTNLTALELSPVDGDLSPLAGLTNLTRLELEGNSISDIAPLAGLTNLTWLNLSGTGISDISALVGLTNLIRVELNYNDISDISALAGLTNLTWLELSGNDISDISALAGLTNLASLGLSYNGTSDISALAGLKNLTWLELSGNDISDISVLAGLTNLTWLNLSGTGISDISALVGLTNLTWLDLRFNDISDISALAGLTNLEYLRLGLNGISDISALVANTGLGDGDVVELQKNPLDDASSNIIIALQDRGATVHFDGQVPEVHVVDPTAPPIYWISAGHIIQRVNLDGSSIQDLVTGLSRSFHLALDVSEGKMYWTEVDGDKIRRANLDGSNVQDLVTGLSFPQGIALDVSGGKMYWIDSNLGKIQRANLDGSQVEDLVTGLYNVKDIALDVSGGKMYWKNDQAILCANLDGTNVESICWITGSVSDYIALDISGDKIYWTHATKGEIFRSNLDCTNHEDLVTGLNSPQGIALDVSGGKMYWAHSAGIQRANLDGTNIEDVVTGLKVPDGIALDISLHPGTVTEPPTPDSDFDGNGTVGISDFLQFVEQFGFSQSDAGYDARFDLDGDGVIGVGDFLIFVNDFGKKIS